MRNDAQAPIGVFDSGLGGLTVLRALMARLPNESTLYLGDTARLPYGTKSAEVVTRYSLKNAQFLTERGIKLLVVACNTASAVALPTLRERLEVPVLGVIVPGAEAAAARSRSGRIGVIATPGTIRSGAYQQALVQARSGVFVHPQACPLFVPLVEEGWVEGEVPRAVAERYLAAFDGLNIDTLVLGCTHYPLLREVIAAVMGPEVTLVDSGEAAAGAIAQQLTLEGGLASSATLGTHQYFLTDVPDRFLELGARFLGRAVDPAHQVDLSFG